MMDFSRSKFDIIGKSKIWYSISIVVIVLGLIGMVRNIATGEPGDKFPLIRGIDFAGGSILQYHFDTWDAERDTAEFVVQVKGILEAYTDKSPQVQTSPILPENTDSGQPGLLLDIRADASLIENQEAQDNLFREIQDLGGPATIEKAEEVSAVIGKELTANALKGVLIGLVLILVYITIRLSLDFAIFAVVALFHDVLILCGIFALFQIEINSPFVAILLTVVGYSINDTIVIYDRIRENMKVKRHLTFDRLVNQSLLETMARSINTSFTTLLAILALLIFGGVSLQTFMIGLGVGVLTGTYSSIFVASLLLVTWRMKGKALPSIEANGAGTVTEIIRDDEDDLIDMDDEDEVEEDDAAKPDETRSAKTKKKKKRRRRH